MSKDYTDIVTKEAIDGKVIEMMGRSEFSEIGITAFGDWKKIEASLTQLKNGDVERQVLD